MADVDIDPFGEHESRTEEPTDENIPLDPVGGRWALQAVQLHRPGNWNEGNKKLHLEEKKN